MSPVSVGGLLLKVAYEDVYCSACESVAYPSGSMYNVFEQFLRGYFYYTIR